MRFSRYPEYKDSGADWLGSVPSHWTVTRLKNVVEIRKRIAGELGFDVLSITQKGIRKKDIDSNDGQLSMDYSKYQLVNPGDFAMNHMDLLTGYVDISPFFGVTSPDYRVFSVRNHGSCHDRFLLRIFQNCYENKIFFPFGQGSSHLGRWRLPTEQFNEFIIALPPPEEQLSIAKFIDYELVTIENLIGDQERLIALLKEKRQAVISRAVTHGLDPRVPMKDSGIEWLGDVPASWKVMALKRLIERGSSISYGIVQPGDPQEVGIPFVQTTNMSSGGFDIDRLQRTTAEIASAYPRSRLKGGEVLLGIRASIGAAYVAPAHLKGANLSRGVARIECCSDLMPEFLAWYIRGDQVEKYWELLKQGSTFNEVSIETVREMKVPLPSFDEQREIAEYIEEVAEGFDELIEEAEIASALLMERRSALIFAAVTGKIDVRQLAVSEVA